MSIRQAALVSEQLNQEIGSDPFGYAQRVARPVDCADAEQFPEIAEARRHLIEMDEFDRLRLEAEWRS